MFWFDKTNKDTIYMDIREFEDTLCDGRHFSVKPDVIGDFRNIPFDDETFNMVVFDPPHLIKAGDNSWLVKNMENYLTLGHKISNKDLMNV